MSAASQLFDWPIAKAALNEGWRVRRAGWTDDRWLERWTGGLIWLILADGSKRVVLNTDFGVDEFTALDWTNLPPECVTSGTAAGTGINGCPLPYSPTKTPTCPTPSPPINPSDPPSGGSGAGQTGGGSSSNTPRRDPPNTSWPTLSLSIQDSQDTCYERGNYSTDFVSPIFTGTVSLSQPSNYNGPSIFFVSVKNGPSTFATCSIGPGGSYGFEWTDPLPARPGSTLTFTARAWASGAPDLQITASADIAPWCQYSLAFDCAVEGGYCHTGVGWVTIRDATATLVYDGCPNQGSLGLGAGVVITAGCTVTVRYSNSDGPCPGGHQCDAAIFNITLWHSGHSVAVGTANLNNGEDGGDRGPFTFPITQAMMDALDTP